MHKEVDQQIYVSLSLPPFLSLKIIFKKWNILQTRYENMMYEACGTQLVQCAEGVLQASIYYKRRKADKSVIQAFILRS